MKLIVCLFIILFVLLEFFGSVRANGSECTGFLRIILACVGSALLSLVLGLPILGILALLGL